MFVSRKQIRVRSSRSSGRLANFISNSSESSAIRMYLVSIYVYNLQIATTVFSRFLQSVPGRPFGHNRIMSRRSRPGKNRGTFALCAEKVRKMRRIAIQRRPTFGEEKNRKICEESRRRRLVSLGQTKELRGEHCGSEETGR